MDFRRLTDNAALHMCARRNILRLDRVAFRIDLPVLLIEIELRNKVDQFHVRLPIGA